MTATPSIVDLSDACTRSAAEAYLAAALTRTRLRQPGAQAIELCHGMGALLARLSYAVTDLPTNPFTDRPLLDSALSNGLQAFFTAPTPAIRGPGAFLEAAFGRLIDLHVVEVNIRGAIWRINSGIPLGQWRSAHDSAGGRGAITVGFSSKANLLPAVIRRLLLDMVASPEDLFALNTTPDVVNNLPRW